ncbi:hypothetical protein GCM10011584_34230 [Nocardioides phosphati]|uniref:Sigma-70 family RNA polymerase sigma factor n=1 Tax=Nocardioides phosphati TaxID=1867775 RepID=A0ABQ2NDQ2_9ACTN|nr:hypothetical protein [Nocardioides phosphati]GGO94061.1 hypothetical protein GCM10011584_34230 [Nocardioides phosphati]
MYDNEEATTQAGYRRTVPLDPEKAEDLMARAIADGCGSPSYITLREHLWAYALPVMKDALRTGKIKTMLEKHSVIQAVSSSDRVALHSDLEARDALAVDVVAAGEQHFRDVTIERERWRPDGGSSIETFFVTGCLFAFPKAYRAWSRERVDRVVAIAKRYPEAFAPGASADTAQMAVDRELLRTAIRLADDETRAILALLAAGSTHAEVGEVVGLSARAVEGRVYRFKKTVQVALGGRGKAA